MFWCLYDVREFVYHIPELDLLVIHKHEEGVLTVYDAIGRRIPPFADFYPFISDPGDQAVEFLFMTDKLGLDRAELVEVTGNGTHLMGQFPARRRAVYSAADRPRLTIVVVTCLPAAETNRRLSEIVSIPVSHLGAPHPGEALFRPEMAHPRLLGMPNPQNPPDY